MRRDLARSSHIRAYTGSGKTNSRDGILDNGRLDKKLDVQRLTKKKI